MNRGDVRDWAMDRLHDSRLGRYGWLMDAAEWLGCRVAGHRGFDEMPDMCRHCGADIDVMASR